jgi:hypothetical protein
MISTRSVPMKDAKEGHAADLYDERPQSAQCTITVLLFNFKAGCIDHWCDHCERRRCTACISGSVTVSPVTVASTAMPRSWVRFQAKCTGIGQRTEASLRVRVIRVENIDDEDRPIERATVLQEHRRAPLKRKETRTDKVVVGGGGGRVRACILPAQNELSSRQMRSPCPSSTTSTRISPLRR